MAEKSPLSYCSPRKIQNLTQLCEFCVNFISKLFFFTDLSLKDRFLGLVPPYVQYNGRTVRTPIGRWRRGQHTHTTLFTWIVVIRMQDG